MHFPEDRSRDLVQSQKDRRRFITRNVMAIGAIAATAAVGKSTPASANCGNSKPVGKGCAPCFLKGTKIRTLDGERNIEDLAVGDLAATHFGEMRGIQWIGRFAHKKDDRGTPWPGYAKPARIARSALAPNVPHADLFVSGGHALFIDDILIPASSLVNGTTIAFYDADEFDELEYYHVKLETHDVIYAEGVACESLQTVKETASNFAEYRELYGEPKIDEAPCAPLICYEGRRGKIMSRIRSAVSPWVDYRTQLDVIRDRLEERAAGLLASQPATDRLPAALQTPE